MAPGNHDATRTAEPQLPIGVEWSKGLREIPNLQMVSSPAWINIHSSPDFPGFNVLLYHGASFHYYIANVERLRLAKAKENPAEVVKYLLQKRHLAPAHTSTVYVPDMTQDPLLIDKIPDIVICGDMHMTDIDSYNGVTIINSSCWQATTDYQKKKGYINDPGKVPVINLKTREVKMIKFAKDE